MIKKLLILFIFLISLNTIYSYNDSLTDLYLDYNIISDCAGKDISFLVMNSSDYESRDEIEDDLCGINETPDKDNWLKFDLIDNVEITIYNGVFDELPILYSGKTNKSEILTLNLIKVDIIYLKFQNIIIIILLKKNI